MKNMRVFLTCGLLVMGTILVIPNGAKAQNVYYNAYIYTFEYDSEGWVIEGDGQWQRESGSHYESPLYSFHGYRDETYPADSYLTSPEVRFPSSTDLTILFANYRRFLSPQDIGELRIRAIGDQYWTTLASYTTDTVGEDMVFEEVSVPLYFQDKFVKMQFFYHAYCGNPNVYEGWFIDTIIVRGSINEADLDTDEDGLRDDDEENMDLLDFARYTFEYDSEDWAGDGLWERTDTRSHSPRYSYHCGRDLTLPYDSYLTSQEIRLPVYPYNAELSYWVYLDFIPVSTDTLEVRLKKIGGPPYDYHIESYDSSDPQETWIHGTVPIDQFFVHEVVRLVFLFHSDEGDETTYEGVYVDDIRLSARTNPLTYDTDNDGLNDGDEYTDRNAYKYTFEYDSEGWIADGLWERESVRSHSPLYAYHCGRDPDIPYDSYLTSPVIKLPMSEQLTFSFWYWLDLGPLIDSGELRIRVIGGQYDITLRSYWHDDPQEIWTPELIDITDYADEYVQLIFYFHSGAGDPTDEGWYIDDINILGSANPLNPDVDHEGLDDGYELENYYDAYLYDFDTGSQGWEGDENGLWERTTDRSYSPDYSYHCGRDESVSYYSYLTSPVIKLPNSPHLTVSFYYFMDFIPYNDIGEFRIRIVGSGPDWTTLSTYWTSVEGETGWLQQDPVDITDYADETVEFQFFYYSYRGNEGTYEGWYIDDFEVEGNINFLTDDTDSDGFKDKFERKMLSLNDWRNPLAPNKRFAVLISGQEDMEEFWNDLEDLYYILRDYGYGQDDIYVLYHGGQDERQTPESPIVDFDSTKANIDSVFQTLSTKMGPYDFLFVWTFDHGDTGGGHSTLLVTDGYIRDDYFAGSPEPGTNFIYTGHVSSYARRLFIMGQCFSGGFIDDLSSDNTMIMTCGRSGETCHRADNEDKDGNPKDENEGGTRFHSEFFFYVHSAFKWEDPSGNPVDADSNDNGYVSVVEAFNYAWDEESQSEHPQYDDNGDGNGNDGPIPSGGDGLLGMTTYL